ncbi:transport permease protein [Flavimobilis marinus]|uniref:Transport permease protein n=1 Tax=Flavimobilis marinus TaxID=285351 RepID=A0A1I2EYF2_9MICO|nr:ABC transporter permease [Flavimobilis marinus]GHG53625.1 transport permease protein [Flavimobilis marinus]SFE98154.1 ABC-2 type transport system permease protein [Flavimobilis marinus]
MTATTGAAPRTARLRAQAGFEVRAVLRNGEQLMVTLLLPALLLVGLVRTDVVSLTTDGATTVDFVTPGVLALAVLGASFTSQAIATAFDRRNGVLRMLATTPLGRRGLLAGKVLGVLGVELVQVVVLGAVALWLGWSPDPAGIATAVLALVLGTAAFTALALVVAGTLRPEGVLALANILLVVLVVAGGVIVPADQLPGVAADLAQLLPSAALGDALRAALTHGAFPVGELTLLTGWAAALWALATRVFRWS